jgi:hypothetical protein
MNNNVKDCLILNFLSIKFIDKWNKHRKWYIKSLSNPKNLEELKINIENLIERITPEMLINTSDNMIKRVKACSECDEKHFQHLV